MEKDQPATISVHENQVEPGDVVLFTVASRGGHITITFSPEAMSGLKRPENVTSLKNVLRKLIEHDLDHAAKMQIGENNA